VAGSDEAEEGDEEPAPDTSSWQEGTTSVGTPGANHRDDLKAINGIGPVMERTLNSLGIQSWEQIAAFTEDDVARVSAAIQTFPGRIQRDDWIGGARELLEDGHVPGEDTSKRTSSYRRRGGRKAGGRAASRSTQEPADAGDSADAGEE
jgi:predicted flap endonuclease-1-like 5' DNA nuclease